MTTTRNNTTQPKRSPNLVQVNTTPGSSASTAGSHVTSDPSVPMIAHLSANTNTTSNPAACNCQAVPGWAVALLVLASAVLLLLLLLALLLWCCCRTRRKGLVVFEQQSKPRVIPLYDTPNRWDQTNGGNQDALEKSTRTGSYNITEQ
ncbi:uncharacterized protein LOC110016734 [Oryzias latipes]|uniref:uncharacterized protein LOC110016734 n=1 Tax=Oryzias latipes TaxID=8090 RepID=UPI000CE186A9|nr:uncharacterized protein LOC110016734 [Oryzias latipes]